MNAYLSKHDFRWEKDGYCAVLRSTLTIERCSFHVEAIQVRGKNSTTAVSPEMQQRITDLQELDGGQGEYYNTLDIEGKHYLVIITPYQL